ncbi:hypothetical protein [Pseudomonas parafulva]|uniref:hypothetical protein n=1 Tax=Pseudomonas parafulva TaxID=157782 RepID=UPI0004174BA5|nr:hypothetical protein [Pseudomonas parafulva]
MTDLIEVKKCTCPSGDGSLRWPCPVHPPGRTDDAVGAGEMLERFTLHELEAVLKGAKPCDLRPRETTAQYLYRGIQRLVKERDRLREDRDGLLENGAHLL